MTARKAGVTFIVLSRVPEVNAAVERAVIKTLNSVAINWHALARQSAPVDTGRLRASIAFSTPTSNTLHTQRYAGSPAKDGRSAKPGGVVSYLPEAPDGLATMVGSNVEYALDVHENHPTHGGFISNPAAEQNDTWQTWLQDNLREIGGNE